MSALLSTPTLPSARLKAAVLGARGYSGLELSRLLLRHPGVSLEAVAATDSNWKLSQYLPESRAKAVPTLSIESVLDAAQKSAGSTKAQKAYDVVFLALPHEASMTYAPKFLEAGVSVIDLSGAFRLESESFEKSYKLKHTASSLLGQADFGLSPWSGKLESAQGKPVLISNPGCFSTSVLMAILPLLKRNVILPETLAIDSKSGTSGAGKKASEDLLFTEIADDFRPYKVACHQHTPEIIRFAKKWSGAAIDPWFTTHLLPIRRGILSSIYATLAPGKTLKDVTEAFTQTYSEYAELGMIEFSELNTPEAMSLLSVKRVVGSPRTHLSYTVSGSKLFLFSAIDNLLKGAASQAVENLNRILNLPVSTGLKDFEGTL